MTLFEMTASVLTFALFVLVGSILHEVRGLKKAIEGSPVSRKLDVVYEGLLNEFHRLDLYVRRPVVRRCTVMLVGKRLDGSPFAWGKAISFEEAESVRHERIDPQEPLDKGVIVFVVGDASLYSASLGNMSLSPWSDSGALFAMTGEAWPLGIGLTVGVKAA